MISDEERREVARRLREIRLCKSGHIEWWKIAQAIGLKEPAGWFGWEKFEPESVQRLADLIEPTCLACPDVEDTPDGGQFECWSCSVCGNIVSVDPDYDTETDGPAYCEACGHRIVGKGEPTWL